MLLKLVSIVFGGRESETGSDDTFDPVFVSFYLTSWTLDLT